MLLVTPMSVVSFSTKLLFFLFPLHATMPAVATNVTKESVLWRRAAVQLDAEPT